MIIISLFYLNFNGHWHSKKWITISWPLQNSHSQRICSLRPYDTPPPSNQGISGHMSKKSLFHVYYFHEIPNYLNVFKCLNVCWKKSTFIADGGLSSTLLIGDMSTKKLLLMKIKDWISSWDCQPEGFYYTYIYIFKLRTESYTSTLGLHTDWHTDWEHFSEHILVLFVLRFTSWFDII